MKKLFVLAMVPLMLAGNAMARPEPEVDKAMDSVELYGIVDPYCEVGFVNPYAPSEKITHMWVDMDKGAKSNGAINLFCNMRHFYMEGELTSRNEGYLINEYQDKIRYYVTDAQGNKDIVDSDGMKLLLKADHTNDGAVTNFIIDHEANRLSKAGYYADELTVTIALK